MAEAQARRPGGADGATFAIIVLTAMNLLNYVDRWVPASVKDLYKADLHLSDAQTSYPTTAFVIVYMLASPVFGALADRYERKRLVAVGVALWSAATAAAAAATGFWSFLVARAFVGVGEAAYATLSPSIISDFFSAARRNRVLTLFYVAIPVGSAIGFTVGGKVGVAAGWRAAFLVCGLPGLLTALLALFIREPVRGAVDAPTTTRPVHWPDAVRTLSRNRTFVVTVLGYTAVTFAMGALGDWFPTFLSRHRGFALDEADTLVGTTGAVGGLAGTLLGGVLADRLKGRTRQPYLALSAGSMLLATVSAVAVVLVTGRTAIVVSLFFAQTLVWLYNGPVNALIVNSVGSELRPRAVSLSILSIHLLGDAASPSIVGQLSQKTSLPFAVSLVPVALAVGTLVWGWGWRTLPEPVV